MSRALCLFVLAACGSEKELSVKPVAFATSTQTLTPGTYTRHVTIHLIPPTERVVPIESRGQPFGPFVYATINAETSDRERITVDTPAGRYGFPSYTLTNETCPIETGCTLDFDLTVTIAGDGEIALNESFSRLGSPFGFEMTFSEWQ